MIEISQIMQIFSKKLFICFTIAPITLAYYLKWRRKQLKENESTAEKKIYYKNLFIFHRKACRGHVILYKPCDSNCPQNHLTLLVDFIASAKQSISICVLTMQLLNILEKLLQAHQGGIKVRIILDREMIATNSQKLLKLREAGIPIKTQMENSCLHHKFCIVDENDETSSKLFFGSMNLTMQGILCNYEHITLTNNFHMINRFVEEFNVLWNEFNLMN